MIKSNHNISLINPVWNEGCLMTYDAGQVNANGGAFSLNFINQSGAPGYKGYPNGSIGAFKGGGNYSQGIKAACGLPIQIKDLNYDLRMKWKVSQLNATDPDDKWWASINVIFDSTAPNLEPIGDDRDYDLVIELNRYEQEDFVDVPSATNQVYWYYARNTDKTLKTLDFNYNGIIYSWVVRYKFVNYPVGHSNYADNNKVHVKFTPLFNSNVAPFLDHSLKKFIDTSVDYLQNVNLTNSERALAQEKVGNSNLYIKNINAGYEVYTGTFTIANDYFYTVLDSNPPASPANLVVTTLSNQVSLDWNDNLDSDFNSYKIFRATNGGAYSVIATNVNVSNYLDATTTTGNNYSYYVVADDRSYNVSNPSNSQNITLNTKKFEKEVNLVVYPNPTENTFTIETNFEIKKVELFSTDGKLVSFSIKDNTYDVSKINKGIYFLKIQLKDTEIVKKLIVK
ncbi:T9SS type A sorting domain-containing protein [Flavobacterium alvei]|uniref:T9SS type A sorting domain-containing protein n=1 Tax=Flavobacterium alvei TaxID=2080416 RepID=UPI0013FE27C5|nr:T9SS type A sorting domain-containing protein [Flavobacterium alvei]